MLQGPVTIMTSNPRISTIRTHTHTHTRTDAHMHVGSVTQAQYPVLRKPFVGVAGLVAAAAVAVCAVVVGRDLYPERTEQPPQNACD